MTLTTSTARDLFVSSPDTPQGHHRLEKFSLHTMPDAGDCISVDLPLLVTRGGKTRISSKIFIDGEDKELWFEVDAAYSDYLATDTLDAFVLASILPAILRRKNIQLRGAMSSKLYYNLAHHLIPLLSDYLDKPRVVKLIPGKLLTAHEKKGDGVISGFSGGIDSFFNYYNHSGDRSPKEFHITHFVFNNIGSHGQDSADDARAIFATRYARLKRLMQIENKPFIAVDSNLDEFIGLNFEQTYTIRNAVVSLLMQNVIGKAIYASSNTYSDTKIKVGNDMSKLDAVVIPLFGTERLESILDGAQLTRVEKTTQMTNIDARIKYLDVCITPEDAPEDCVNCSACTKCLRTITTLDVQGTLGLFSRVFVLERYSMLKNIYLIEVLSSRAALAREVKDFIRQEKYPVPRAVRIISAFVPYFCAWFISGQLTPVLVRKPRLARLINTCLSW